MKSGIVVIVNIEGEEMGVEKVIDPREGEIIAILVRSSYRPEGLKFLTDDNNGLQVGVMAWPTGHTVEPHLHNKVDRRVSLTQEVLVVRKGRVRANFYSNGQEFITSRILLPNDVLILLAGGHGFEMVEPSEMIEVKQGPYLGESEKTRFWPGHQ